MPVVGAMVAPGAVGAVVPPGAVGAVVSPGAVGAVVSSFPGKAVIVGNGVAGITCALHARQRDPQASITVVSGETDYFFSRTALMYSYMDMMTRRDLEPYERVMYREQRIRLVRDWVVDLDAERQEATLEKGEVLPYDKLVLAVGAAPNLFNWEGIHDIQDGLVHFVSMQDLDTCERLTPSTKTAVVVGGGLIGIELVECLLHHGVDIKFLIREPWYWPMALSVEEADFVSVHMREHGVDVRLSEEMTKVETDANGRVSTVHTNKGDAISCQMLGITAGVHPNIKRLKEFKHQPEMGRGIIVNERFETSLPNVYAAGDCAEIHPESGKPYGELIWYSAKRHGAQVARNLFGDELTYKPPLFFNSSKFFEIEYTTVGNINAVEEGSPTLFRKMPGKNISQRIICNHDNEVVGFNMLGSRWNHEVLERWVHERRSMEFVRQHLAEAQYDVEFGRVNLKKMDEQAIPLAFFR